MSMPSKDKDLEPVTDMNMVQRYLKYGFEFHEIVSCYAEEGNLRFEALMRSVDTNSLIIDMEISEETFAKIDAVGMAVLDSPKSELRISYSVNEATFFVHCKMQGRTTRRLVVKADMPMYKLQRREALRIKVMESHKATVKLGATVLPLFDISAGGLSIVISLKDEKNYKKEQAFPNATLSFMGKDYKVDLEVKNVLNASKDGQKVKVGLGFKSLPAAIEQMIAREAYLHTHKIWSRWL